MRTLLEKAEESFLLGDLVEARRLLDVVAGLLPLGYRDAELTGVFRRFRAVVNKCHQRDRMLSAIHFIPCNSGAPNA